MNEDPRSLLLQNGYDTSAEGLAELLHSNAVIEIDGGNFEPPYPVPVRRLAEEALRADVEPPPPSPRPAVYTSGPDAEAERDVEIAVNASALGEVGKELLVRLENENDVSLRADLRWMLRQPDRIFASREGALRLAATRSDPNDPMIGASIYTGAMRQYAHEKDSVVRKGIADLWMRRRRPIGDVPSADVLAFFADVDPDLRARVAEVVVSAKVTPPEDERAVHDLAREILVAHAREWAQALDDARARGKEPFDWPRLVASGCRLNDEREHRYDYYLVKRGVLSMEEYIALRRQSDGWGVL